MKRQKLWDKIPPIGYASPGWVWAVREQERGILLLLWWARVWSPYACDQECSWVRQSGHCGVIWVLWEKSFIIHTLPWVVTVALATGKHDVDMKAANLWNDNCSLPAWERTWSNRSPAQVSLLHPNCGHWKLSGEEVLPLQLGSLVAFLILILSFLGFPLTILFGLIPLVVS